MFLAIAATAILSPGIQSATEEMRLLRFPAVHGENVYFTHGSDLWVSNLSGGIARRLTSHPNNESRARVSPDGKLVAFTASYDGNADVFVMPAEGGEPKRLTYEIDPDLVAGWTPGGDIAYISNAGSNFGGLPRLWTISPTGGMPKPTPVLEAADVSFSPDGKRVAYHRMGSNNFNWRRYRGGSQGRISVYDLESNTYSELPSGRENSYSPMWIGNSVYYVSDKDFGTVNLYRYDFGSKRARRLTEFKDGDIKWPSSDDRTIVFERDGYLYAYDVAAEKLNKLSPRVVSDRVATRPVLKKLANQIGWISLSPTGVRLAVEARGELFSLPAKTGDVRNFSNSQGVRERFPTWSPDGKTIAYISDRGGEYQIYTQGQMGGAETKITEHKGTSINYIDWSPDSKKILFSTEGNDLMVVDTSTRQVSNVTKGRYGSLSSFDWSPDSKWIAYVDAGPNLFGQLFLHELATGKSAQVTEGYFRDDAVSFDTNGKYLYLISGRIIDPTNPGDDPNVGASSLRQRVYMLILSKDQTSPLVAASDEEPEAPAERPAAPAAPAASPAQPGPPPGPKGPPEVKIDFEGLGDRLVPLPFGPGFYPFVIGLNEGALLFAGGAVVKFDVKSRETQPVLTGPINQLTLNASRSKMAYIGQGTLGVVDVRPGNKVGDGRVSTDDVEAVIAPSEEWKQIFWDAWRYQRDNFYDPNFLGLDWNAIGQHYSKFLPYASHRSDLTYILGLMIGEFGTSHAYVGGGDPGMGAPLIPVGHLGADYKASEGKLRFERIYKGLSFEEPRRGPLGEPGVNVKVGDYLLAIDGKSVDANTNPHSLMVNKVGKFVTLTVNDKPTVDGSRKVRVKPIGSEEELRYIEWVEGNRRYVSQASNGRIGYMHVPDTSVGGAVEFVKGFYSNSDKEALVVDERFNGGGYIPTFFVERLARRYSTYIRQRHGADIGFPVQSVDGPMAMLINGYAGSGGDHFPWLFRKYKLGPLVGTRTWGGLVGIAGGFPLVDGGQITSPEFGLYDQETGKWIAENEGVEPDIEVDARPDLIFKGKDPQLDKAIEYLKKELERRGPRKIKRPDFPRVKPNG